MVLYDPESDIEDRLQRYDTEPWHLFDNCDGVSCPKGSSIAKSILALESRTEQLGDVAPLLLPSLGLMLPFGSTFRMRLRCALALARTQPKTNLLGRGASKYVYEQVLGICRHYPTIIAPLAAAGSVPMSAPAQPRPRIWASSVHCNCFCCRSNLLHERTPSRRCRCRRLERRLERP